MGWLRSPAERIRTFSRLTSSERTLFLQAWISLIRMDITLRIVPVKRLLDRYSSRRTEQMDIPEEETEAFISRAAWLVESAGRFAPIRTTCLKESLVLSRILDRNNIDTELRIGVTRTGEHLKAHAWLERNGVPIFGYDPEDGYQPLAPS
ncbi:lasso peptide biosynthesis B2 protein [Gemmatimonadota bacterium]